jgi:hypothetical protein
LIRDYKDVFNTDGWDFTENTELFDIDINHGEGTCKKQNEIRVKPSNKGHLHTQLYVEYAGANSIVWGMQVVAELILNLRYGLREEFIKARN